MPQGKGYSQRQLDAMAREKGFPNYAAFKAWNEKYRAKKSGPATQAKPKNFLQSLMARIPGHPAQTLGHVNKKMKEAQKK